GVRARGGGAGAAGGAGRVRRALPGGALGRDAAAHRHRADTGRRASDPPDGRAVRGARRADAAPARRQGAADPPRAGPDLAPDHPQPDRGGAARRPGGGHDVPARAHQAAGRDRPAPPADLPGRGEPGSRAAGRGPAGWPGRGGLAGPGRGRGRSARRGESGAARRPRRRAGMRSIVGRVAICAIALAALGLAALPAAAQAPDRVRAGIGQRGNWDTMVVPQGVEVGLFKKENLDIEVTWTRGGAETLQALVTGSTDVDLANGILGVIGAYAKGAPVRVIGAEFTGAHDLFWYTKGDSPVKSMKEMDGRTMGYSRPGSS